MSSVTKFGSADGGRDITVSEDAPFPVAMAEGGALGSLSDPVWNGVTANPSAISILKRCAGLLQEIAQNTAA